MRQKPKSLIRKQSREVNQHRVFRAFLAEEYDGIGQFVKITLSKNAVTVGLLARISSGDFGTGQTIPVGTPVSVFSYRGKLEILSLGAK